MTIKGLTDEQITNIKESLDSFLVDCKDDNVMFLFKNGKFTITIYNTKTILLQGEFQHLFSNELAFLNEKTNSNKTTQDVIGCDESGVGDYFGPVVYACAYINEKDQEIEELKGILVDSKMLSDSEIINNYNIIKKYARYEVFVDEVLQFNKKMEVHKNQNYLKVENYYNLLRKFLDKNNDLKCKVILLDQFTSLDSFKKHAKNIDKTGIKFALSTKAESKFLNVACASIIARRYYLKAIEELEEKYSIKIKKGADTSVKKLVKEIKEKLPNDWESLIKKHFKI